MTLDAVPSPKPDAVWPFELLRYFFCSALALGVDIAIFSLGLRHGLGWAAAAAAGFSCGLVVAYALSVRFVFSRRSLSDSRVEFALFAGIGLLGLLLTEFILWLLVARLHADAHASKLVAAGFVFLFNFTARKLLLFRQSQRGQLA
ncbi:MAG: GtrA family protein [Rubrivivax sp.]|nr:GtrA family protein [Rubrivivax sp.]